VDPGEVVDRAILEVENVLLANKVPQNIIRELPKPYYEDDGVIIYNCTCEEVLLSTLSDSVDLCLTDPPYDKKTHEKIMTSGDSGKGELSDVGFNYITIEKMYEIFGQVSRICSKWTILTLDLEHAIKFYKQPPSGMEYIRWGIYHKTHHAPQYSGDRPSMGWEPIAIMHRAGKKKVWNGGGTDSVFTYKPPMRGIHPTQKSESFYSEIMKLFTNPGDVVFDPFMGGGTTAICARRMGRRAICVEMQEKYCEAVAKQLQQVDINTFVHRKIKTKQELLIDKSEFTKKEKK
jgi:site-specific DNA-methyltransferase (adenine-specific)